ncbi:MAG: hypothetical protein V4719_16840 [Planctomycetota bacterium]
MSSALVLMFVSGCGESGPTDQYVTGTVTFDGQPVKDGQIVLTPTEPGVTPDSGSIKDGKFAFATRKGEKSVQIEALRDVPGKTITLPPPLSGTKPVTEMYIPAVYNKKTKLKVTVTDSSSKNKFDFKLTTDGSGN